LILLGFTVPYLWRVLSRKMMESHVALSYDVTKNQLIISPQDPNTAYLVVPASAPWVDTGIDVEAGEVIRIDAIGHAHLSLRQLYEAIDYDSMPRFQWIDPDGSAFAVRRPQDSLRQDFLLSPGANMGKLLGYFWPSGSAQPQPSRDHPRPGGMLEIGRHATIKNPLHDTARLFLVLNDMVLDPSRMEASKRAYIGPYPKTDPHYPARSKRWEYVVRNRYWYLWFDDNIGQFLVQVHRHAS
jgi:hypothetical protein